MFRHRHPGPVPPLLALFHLSLHRSIRVNDSGRHGDFARARTRGGGPPRFIRGRLGTDTRWFALFQIDLECRQSPPDFLPPPSSLPSSLPLPSSRLIGFIMLGPIARRLARRDKKRSNHPSTWPSHPSRSKIGIKRANNSWN